MSAPKTTDDNNKVTIEQVEHWLGSDWSFSNICETLQS